MGFGSRKGLTKGHHDELLHFDAVVNDSTPQDLQAMVSELANDDRLMEVRKRRLDTKQAPLADWVDRHWFGLAGQSMWSSSSRNTVGEIHAIMRENAMWLMQQRAADPGLTVSMWAICDSDDFYVLINRFAGPDGVELRAEIHGPDNMVEGPDSAESKTLDEVQIELLGALTVVQGSGQTSSAQLSLEQQREFAEKIENSADVGKAGYFGTALGLNTTTNGVYPGRARVTDLPGDGARIDWPTGWSPTPSAQTS